MRRLIRGSLFICGLASAPVGLPQGSARLEKVAEGQYLQWQNGHPVMDTAQSWTIWRTNDGFEVEDKLPEDKGVMLMAGIGAGLNARMSPELREDMKNLTMKTDIDLQLTKQKAIQVLVLNGRKLNDSKQVAVANCQSKGNEIVCKGHEASARLKNAGQDQLLYAYPFPLLFTQVLNQSRPAPAQTNPVTLAVLEEVNNKYQLTRVSGQLRGEGPERIVVGQDSFATEKFVLAFVTKNGARQITLWTLNEGIVFAMEDSRFAAGLRVLLSQYKRFSDF
jgi:hypothetical protein